MTAITKIRDKAVSSLKAGPSAGNWRQRLRLWSGLILLAFCLTHFSNHALGIISVDAMEAGARLHYEIWGKIWGKIALPLAAIVHVSLALWRTMRRRTLRMSAWEFIQLVLGLYIPWTLIPHVIVTLGLQNKFGLIPTYHQMLTLLWPNAAFMQSVLLIVVWIHAMIGLHFWLRLYPFYRRFLPVFAAAAVGYPLLALWGWIEGARRLALEEDYQSKVTAEQFDWVIQLSTQVRAVVFGLIILSLLVVLIRIASRVLSKRITILYPGDVKVRTAPGPSLLEVSRMNAIPHAAVCGGRARCSTCRVLILEGGNDLPEPSNAEQVVLNRIGADNGIRLACQIRPQSNLQVRPLVAAKASEIKKRSLGADAYHWGVEQQVVIMFVDLRNFTHITETNLSYDVVFLLNRYLDTVSAAIRAEDGHVDKFIGDGIMAIFGMQTSLAEGARQALRASARIGDALSELNEERGPQFKDPLRLGIGLHAGPAILGRIGAAGTSGNQGSITALGDVVNTASRLETENKVHGTALVVSQDVLDAANAELSGSETAEIILRGKTKPLKIHMIRELTNLSSER